MHLFYPLSSLTFSLPLSSLLFLFYPPFYPSLLPPSQTSPMLDWSCKYNHVSKDHLPPELVASYGRQILEVSYYNGIFE